MTTDERWALTNVPGLDGLRGIAILLVVAAHTTMNLEALGGVGVTVFFTLSGFLITALVLSETDQTGLTSIRRFYVRRFWRLAPAFLLMLVVVVPIEYALTGSAPYWWTTLAEVSNWVSATHGAAELMLLHHTWSLAIEEQFYLIWPGVLLITQRRYGRNGVVTVAVFGIVASLTAATISQGPRLSFATDTNAWALLTGCLLAALMTGRRMRRAPHPALPVGVAMIALDFAVPLGTALAIWTVSTRSIGWLSWGPLRGAGRISYGWYLWNYPATLLGLLYGMPSLMAPTVSLAIALLSWRYLERPLLQLGPSAHKSKKHRSMPAVTLAVDAG